MCILYIVKECAREGGNRDKKKEGAALQCGVYILYYIRGFYTFLGEGVGPDSGLSLGRPRRICSWPATAGGFLTVAMATSRGAVEGTAV